MIENYMNKRVYIKLLRREKNLTLDKIASKIYISTSKLSEYENGKINLDPFTEEKICNILEISLDNISSGYTIDGLTMPEFYKKMVVSIILDNNKLYNLIKILEQNKLNLKKYLDYSYYYLIKSSYMCAYHITNYQYYYSITKSILKNFTETDKILFRLILCYELYGTGNFKKCLVDLNRISLFENDELFLLKEYLYILCLNGIGSIQNSIQIIDRNIMKVSKIYDFKIEILLLIEKSVAERMMGNFEESLKINYSSLIRCINENEVTYLFSIFYQIGYTLFLSNEYIKAITFLDYAILQKNLNQHKLAYAYFFVSLSYYHLNNFIECKNNLKIIERLLLKKCSLYFFSRWLEAMLNKAYSKKCESLLLEILSMKNSLPNLEEKLLAYELLKNHYIYTDNRDKIEKIKKFL